MKTCSVLVADVRVLLRPVGRLAATDRAAVKNMIGITFQMVDRIKQITAFS